LTNLKIAVLVPDGAADFPVPDLGGRTPLEYADTPNADRVVSMGATGTIATVPAGMPPGSDVANFSLMGYDPAVHYGGRGPIEAANLGIEVPPGWTAFRCNIVTTDGERMLDYSAGHVSQERARAMIEALDESLGDPRTRFYPGKSYRNLLLLEGDFVGVECTPPHDITWQPLADHMPKGPGAQRIVELMEGSKAALAGPGPGGTAPPPDTSVTMIWPWGQGSWIAMESFKSRFGLDGAVISAVDLVMGLGKLAGLRPLEVPGITGYLDTDYEAKGKAAAAVLDSDDFVYVHVEAPDEASHMGSAEEKVRAIERFDELVVGPVLLSVETRGEYRLMVCPDHPTLLSTRTHDATPVPYAACGTGIEPGRGRAFAEREARSGGPHFDPGWTMMLHLSGRKAWPHGPAG